MSEKNTPNYNLLFPVSQNTSATHLATFSGSAMAKWLLAGALLAMSVLHAFSACTPPVINLGADIIQCGGTVTLDAGNPGATYQWNDNSTSQFLVVDSSNTYSVTVTDALLCSASASINITINPPASVNLGPDVSQCGGTVLLNASNGGPVSFTDQQQSNTGALISAFYQKFLAQSFIPSHPVLNGASVQLYNDFINPGPGDITIDLYDNLPNASGNLLASGTATGVLAGDLATVNWPSTAVVPGNTYYLVFSSTDSTLSIDGSVANPYPNGNVIANLTYDNFFSADYAFETFFNTTFKWSDGSTSPQLTVSAGGNYAVTVTNEYNCTASSSINVYIKTVPVVDLGPDRAQCGGTMVLDAGNPGANYFWYDGSTNQSITVNATGSYTVQVTDPNTSCTASDLVKITINQPPNVNLGPDIAQCDLSATLNAGNPGGSYHWADGATTQSITVNTSGFYPVTVTDGAGCTGSAGINVQLYPHPNLGPDKTDAICPFSTADLTTYFITQGLNVTYSDPNPTAVTTGTYTVIASNQYGCADTATVTINTKPVPNLGNDVADSICPFATADLTVLFNTTGLTMDYGTLFPEIATPGVYNIKATNASGCRDTAIVTVSYRQKPDLGPDRADSICIGETYNLTNLIINNNYPFYVWDSPGGPDAVTAGVYTLVVYNQSNCTDTAKATITNRIHPVVTLNEPHDICNTRAPFALDGGLPAGGAYVVDGAPTLTFDPVQQGIGTHKVVYTFTNSSGCTDSAMVEMIVHAQPFITTLLPPDICTTTIAIDLNDYFTPTGGVYSGLGVSTHYFYPVITPSGKDTVVDIYTDQFGCMDTSVYPITIHRTVHPKIKSSVASLSICEGESVTFTASGAEQYEFFVNGKSQGPASDVDSFVTNTLQNHDEVTVAGSNLCSADTVGPIIYDVHPLPVVNAGMDTSIPLPSSVQLHGSATGTGLLIYQWFPTRHLDLSTITNPVYNGPDTVTFTLYASDIYGCIDSDDVTVNVFIPDAIVLPNVITPDGDGKNDTWKINPKVDLRGSNLVIFDRWGDKVFETESYNNDWDGTYRNTGKRLSDGTYYYVFKVPSQHDHVYKGAINILNGK